MPRRPPAFEQFFAIRRFQPALAFTPNSRSIFFSSDISGQFNLWQVPRTGGWPQQLTTFSDNSVRAVAVSPDGKTVLFTADHHGDEFHQLYALPVRGGWPEQWTDAPSVQHFITGEAWSPDGSRLMFAANSREPTAQELWIRDVRSSETRLAFGGDLFAFPGYWSADGRRLTVVDLRSNTNTGLHLVDVETGDATEIRPHDDDVIMYPGPWSPDGSGFFVISDEGREFAGLAHYDVADERLDWVETPDGDVEELAGSADGGVLAWLLNQDGWTRLYVMRGGRTELVSQLPAGAPASVFGSGLTVSPDGRFAALGWQHAQRPPELFVIEIEASRAKRLSDNVLGGLRERDLLGPEAIRYSSFDDREIPAWLYRPKKRGRVPVVLSIHGGPEAQEKPDYKGIYQYLLSRGIGVMATNIRGSTGYGKSYQKLIHRDWGGGDLQDWDYAVRWLSDQDWVDEERIAVFGGSYGGFAVLSCVTRLPDRWAAAVDIFGPSNLVTFAKAVPPTWRRLMAQWVGDPETEVDFLLERSPITYVENVRTPMLVIQGATDPRVVKAESDQLVERLRELGREVEYVVFEDEGHGFTKRENQLRAYRLAAEFLERHLLP